MRRAFVNPAAVRISNQTARHDRAHRRERHDGDEDEGDPVKNPRESYAKRAEIALGAKL
jgi:hypothetical protein